MRRDEDRQKSTISYQFIPRIPFKFQSFYPEAERTKKASNNLVDGTVNYQLQAMELQPLNPGYLQDDVFKFGGTGVNSRNHIKDRYRNKKK